MATSFSNTTALAIDSSYGYLQSARLKKLPAYCLITAMSCVRCRGTFVRPERGLITSVSSGCMKIAKYQIGAPGPFEVRVNAPGESRAAEPADEEMPRRRYDCHSYQHCLELAAALNWESFTCDGCSGEANESLLWRVGQAIRRDSIAKALCATPKISMISGSFNCASARPQSATTQHGELLKPTEVRVTSDRTNR